MIYGLSYSEALARIRDWMNRTHVGPVLVTDGESAEDLLGGRAEDPAPKQARAHHGHRER